MKFEIAKTITEELNNGVECNLNYTQDFVEYDEWAEENCLDLESFEDGILTSLENFVKENNITGKIEATAFLDEDDSYLYIDTTDSSYMLSVLPMGSNEKYRVCIVNSVY